MDVRPREARVAAAGREAPSTGEVRQQLVWFAWLRLVVITTALVTTLLLDHVIKPEQMVGIRTAPLYTVLLFAYACSFLSLGSLALFRSAAVLAGVQFGCDILVETALLHVLGSQGAVAFALALFFLTTLLACNYLDRVQGTVFALGAWLLQVAVAVPQHLGILKPFPTVTGHGLHADSGWQGVALNLFLFMFTFSATAWLVGSRAERLRMVGARLQSVSDDLAELQAFNEHVVRSVGSGLLATGIDGRVTFANPAAEALLGHPMSELRGRRLTELLGWEPSEPEPENIPLVQRVERTAVIDGRRVDLEITVSRLTDHEGRLLGRLHSLEDVTDLRALESEVRLKERMAAIGEMAAGIAHEIRNPLASISGSVQMLERGLRLEGDHGRLMGIVLRESRRLDDTIRAFLEFARPREARKDVFDLAELARETLTLLANSDEVGPDHVLVPPEVGGVEVVADPDQVRQVAWNLCKNALKAMPDGGELRIEVERAAGGEVVMAVEDTGVGMTPQVRERAFQPLTGEFPSGAGLGLAIVYRIVKDHGGRVFIDSERSRGTRIEVRLPAAPVAESARSTEHA